jgi:hypothetical protein
VSAAGHPALIEPRRARQDISDQREPALRTDPTLAKEPMENADTAEPIEPIDSTDPTDPMDRIEPWDHSERIESWEPRDQRAPWDESMDPSSLPAGISFIPRG